MKIKINITKELIQESAYCKALMTSCAFALALKETFPNVEVHDSYFKTENQKIVYLTTEMCDFIHWFDNLLPQFRTRMSPKCFELELPEHILEEIDISDITKNLNLELINA